MLHAFLDEKIEAFKSKKLMKTQSLAHLLLRKYVIILYLATPLGVGLFLNLAFPSFVLNLGNFLTVCTSLLVSLTLDEYLVYWVKKHFKTEISILEKERYARLFNEVKNEKVCLENLLLIKCLLQLREDKYLTLNKVKYYQSILNDTMVSEEDIDDIYHMIFIQKDESFLNLIDDIGEKSQEDLKSFLKEKLILNVTKQINQEKEKADLLNIELNNLETSQIKELFQKPKHHSISVSL